MFQKGLSRVFERAGLMVFRTRCSVCLITGAESFVRTNRLYLKTAGSVFDKEVTTASQHGLIKVFGKGMLLELRDGVLRVSEKVGECFGSGC